MQPRDSVEGHLAEARLAQLKALYPSFARYLDQHKNKLGRKLSKSSRSKREQSNLLHELEVIGLLVCDGRFDVKYEPEADGPDFHVQLSQSSFWVEVTEIGDTQEVLIYEDFVRLLESRLREVRGHYVVDLRWENAMADAIDPRPFGRQVENILKEVARLIAEGGAGGEFTMADSDDRVRFIVRPLASTDTLCLNQGLRPIFARPSPANKIVEVIQRKMQKGQLRAGRPTILVIRTTSEDLCDWHEFAEAIRSFSTSHGGEPTDVKLHLELLEQYQGLAGVVMQQCWREPGVPNRNYLFINVRAGVMPDEVWDFFEEMPLWLPSANIRPHPQQNFA